MRILGLTQGDPFSPHSWSGCNRGLFTALQRLGSLAAVHDVEVYGFRKYLDIACSLSYPMKRWRQNHLKSSRMFMWRSSNAEQLLARSGKDWDAVLQIGAMFSVNYNKPFASYMDSTALLSMQGGAHSFSAYANQSLVAQAIERERQIYHRAAVLFTMSEQTKRSLVDGYGIEPNRVHVAHPGPNIDIPREIPPKMKSDDVLFIGKDFARKGGEVLLQAFSLVRRDAPSARLHVVGTTLPRAIDGVQVHGFVNKQTPEGAAYLSDLFTRAAVFVMPSFFEPFGIPFIEAMYHGTPCIGTTIGAIPEIIVDRETGYLVPPGDPTALAELILLLLTNHDLVRSMGSSGLRRAQHMFSWDNAALRITSALAEAS